MVAGLLVDRVDCVCQWGGGYVPMIGDKDTSWGADCEFVDGEGGNFNTTCSPRGDIVNVVRAIARRPDSLPRVSFRRGGWAA